MTPTPPPIDALHAMKERPILMSAPMVRAILDGRKTQTRRIVKPQPIFQPESKEGSLVTKAALIWPKGDQRQISTLRPPPFGPNIAEPVLAGFACPYGSPGDRIWVKETASHWDYSFEEVCVHYKADEADRVVTFTPETKPEDLHKWKNRDKNGLPKWRPSIFMPRWASLPRWASRITLEITEVRVERLQDISQKDATDEGMNPIRARIVGGTSCQTIWGPVDDYRQLWESINGKGSWEKNPFVWVLTFKRI